MAVNMAKSLFCVLSFFLFSFFPHCGKKKIPPSKKEKLTKSAAHLLTHHIQRAKDQDIPIPVGYHHKKTTTDKTTTYMEYHGGISLEKTKDFYRKEMERHGWDIIDLSTIEQCLLFCSKQKRNCAISLRQKNADLNNKSTEIQLSIFHKKVATL